jgi:hypothetical protein
MEIYDLIILHGQIASLTLEVGDLHVHGTRQRHPYRVGIVPPVAPPTRDQRYVQPRHDAPQLLLHALGAAAAAWAGATAAAVAASAAAAAEAAAVESGEAGEAEKWSRQQQRHQ